RGGFCIISFDWAQDDALGGIERPREVYSHEVVITFALDASHRIDLEETEHEASANTGRIPTAPFHRPLDHCGQLHDGPAGSARRRTNRPGNPGRDARPGEPSPRHPDAVLRDAQG